MESPAIKVKKKGKGEKSWKERGQEKSGERLGVFLDTK
jgi:hypothetical protein